MRWGQAVGDGEDSLAALGSAEILLEAWMEAGGYLPPDPEYSPGSITVALVYYWSALGELRLSPERAEQ